MHLCIEARDVIIPIIHTCRIRAWTSRFHDRGLGFDSSMISVRRDRGDLVSNASHSVVRTRASSQCRAACRQNTHLSFSAYRAGHSVVRTRASLSVPPVQGTSEHAPLLQFLQCRALCRQNTHLSFSSFSAGHSVVRTRTSSSVPQVQSTLSSEHAPPLQCLRCIYTPLSLLLNWNGHAKIRFAMNNWFLISGGILK